MLGVLHLHMFVKSKQYPSERYFQGKHHPLSYLYPRWVSISSVLLCARANHGSVIEGTLSYRTQELTFMIAIAKVQVPSCTLQTQQSRAESVCQLASDLLCAGLPSASPPSQALRGSGCCWPFFDLTKRK